MGEDIEPTASERPAPQGRVGSLVTLAAGSRVGKYEIVATLGQGAFGITYRAHDTQLDRDVALKEYMPTVLAAREPGGTVLPRSAEVEDDFSHGRERFFDEARTLAHLTDTPGVVEVFDYLAANNTAYMAMTLIHGETLDARLKRERRLQQPALEQLLYRLLDGLEVVHRAGFLHRDVKPGNILIDEAGHATLVDFGASRAAVLARTQALTAVYTPGYTAPEQMTSGKQGPWTDIYALAATLYHCVTGRPPQGALERFTGDTLIPATEAGKGRYAPSLLAAIDAGLKLKPKRRPQSIAQWRQVLDGSAPRSNADTLDATTRMMDEQQLRDIEESAPRPAERAVSRMRSVSLIAGGFVALAIAAGGLWMILRPAPETPELTVLRLEEEARRLTAQATKLRQEEEARQRAAAEAHRKAGEEVARRAAEEKAATEAAARQQTEQTERERAAAVEAHRKAEEEAARLAAEEKAAAEAVARRKADEEVAERAVAEATRRRAEEQARADAEARRKAEAEARAAAEEKARADAQAKRQAEIAEATLRLSEPDRKRVQVALTSLGHNTQGSDGTFGPRTRQMIAAWQKSQNAPETGYLTAVQLTALHQHAAPALARYDEEQKKLEDDKRKAEEEARRKQEDEAKKRAEEERRPQPASTAPPSVATTPSSTAPVSVDGLWSGDLKCSSVGEAKLSVQVAAGTGRSSFTTYLRTGEVLLRITGAEVTAEIFWGGASQGTLRGRVSGQRLTAMGNARQPTSNPTTCYLMLDQQPPAVTPPSVAVAPSTMTPAAGRDGQWSGTLFCERSAVGAHWAAPQENLSFQLVGGAGRASFMTGVGPGDVSLRIRGDQVVADAAWGRREAGDSSLTLRGSVSGLRLTASGRLQAANSSRYCTLTLDRQ